MSFMNISHHTLFFALLMFAAGLGIPIMAALNSGLGTKLHSPMLATTILFFVGGAISLGLFFITGGIPKSVSQEPIPLYFYFGGFFVIAYILGITWVAPRFGVGNAVSFVLLGQLISMVIIDHHSLFAAHYNPMTIRRIIGLVLMIVGVFLTVHRI